MIAFVQRYHTQFTTYYFNTIFSTILAVSSLLFCDNTEGTESCGEVRNSCRVSLLPDHTTVQHDYPRHGRHARRCHSGGVRFVPPKKRTAGCWALEAGVRRRMEHLPRAIRGRMDYCNRVRELPYRERLALVKTFDPSLERLPHRVSPNHLFRTCVYR